MRSKYSIPEMETKFDNVELKVSKFDVITDCPETLEPKFNALNIFNANVMIRLLKQVRNFNLQSPDKFVDFVTKIKGWNLISDRDLQKLSQMSSSFVGVFATILDIPNVFKNGSVALIENGRHSKPEFVFRYKKKWFWMDGSRLKIEMAVSDKILIGHNVMRPYKMAKCVIYATNTETTHIQEFNIMLSNNNWWVQISKDTKLDTPDLLFDLKMNRPLSLNTFPEIYITAVDNCEVSIRLDVII